MDQGPHVYRKVADRVVLPLAAMIVLSSIDRVNISFAALRMNADLGFDPKTYGLGASLFFVGYIVCQLPSAALLRRFGARRWIAASVIGWGLAATAMAFISGRGEFFTLRIVLGAFESGFAPGVMWFVSQWLPRTYRARTIGLTQLAIPLSVVIGGPLCGLLLKTDVAGFAGWRLMFLAEGILTILAGLAALAWFADRPADAAWLDEDDRHWIARAIAADEAQRQDQAIPTLGVALRNPALWTCALVWFLLVTSSNAIIFWLPIAIKSFGTVDPLTIGVLSALPWVALGAGMFLNARHSDKAGERFGHIAAAALLGAAGFALAGAAGGTAVALGCLVVGAFGMGGAQTVLWAVPTQLSFGRNPQAIALINLIGNFSGLIAPGAIGWVIAETGDVALPVYAIAILTAAAVPLIALLARVARADRPDIR